jgi:hypothetical protein
MNAYSLSELPAGEWSRQLAAMSLHGVRLVRSDADWGTIQPDAPVHNRPRWKFARYDRWVAALAYHRLTWQPILDYNNSWAQAVKNNTAFAAFGRAVAARYGANGSFWATHPRLPYMPVKIFEVWNEENGQPWYIDPISYGSLYEATRTAIHQVDPQASVDVGGLSDDSQNFDPNHDYPAQYVVRMLLTHPGMEGHIDGFALHPYGTTAADVIEWVGDFRHVLDGFHEGSAPIDLTEFGWVTGDGTQEAWRAVQMSVLGITFSHSSLGLREVAPYDWINPTSLHDAGDFGFVGGSALSTVLRPAASAWFNAFEPRSSGGLRPCAKRGLRAQARHSGGGQALGLSRTARKKARACKAD